MSGGRRPPGIPAREDKIVQVAVGEILSAINEAETAPCGCCRIGRTTVAAFTNVVVERLFEALADPSEEAIVNALVSARAQGRVDGYRVEPIPKDHLQAVRRMRNRVNDPMAATNET